MMTKSIDDLKNLTIFHIGNIANNAYNAAASERRLGLNSFAISPDYLHLMGFPFWETEELEAEYNNHFSPNKFISPGNIPNWFIWGNWAAIYETLIKILRPDNKAKEKSAQFIKSNILRLTEFCLRNTRFILKRFFPSKFRHWLANSLLYGIRANVSFDPKKVFELADILVFYGPYNAYAISSQFTGHYMSLEHGTLRDWINSGFKSAEDSKIGYLKSDFVFITNQDCYQLAIEMGIRESKLIRTPHPSSDWDFVELRLERLKYINSNSKPVTILCPARHSRPSSVDVGKGNEIVIAALVKAAKLNFDIKIQFVEWGDDVDESKNLISEYGIIDQVEWLPVMSRKLLKKKMAESTLLIDQFKIDGYGAILADALGLGLPVISRQNLNLDNSFFGKAPSIFSASTEEEIFNQIIKIANDADLIEIFYENTKWYDAHLSSEIALSNRLNVYRQTFKN